MKAIVIGAGVAGLAAAIRLVSKGYDVSVFEANAYPGGKLTQFEKEGYRFDAGPSLFTMPQYIEELINLETSTKVEFDYKKLETVCHYFWEDKTRINAFANKEAFADEVERALGVSKEIVLDALQKSKEKYELTGEIFLNKSLHRLDTWTNLKVAKAMFKIPQYDIFRSMNATNEAQVKHPKLVQLFNRFATYNGSNPYKAPGLLNIIPHFEHGIGAFYPNGGMHHITETLYELAISKSVTFHFNVKVDEILVENGQAIGIKAGGEIYKSDIVMSNMDVYYTYKRLLPNEKHPESTLKQERSTSALIFYWGIKKTFPALGLHNILFSNNYKKEFDSLEEGEIDKDPTVYINITSKLSPEHAPEGCENWFILVNAPHDKGQNWEAVIEELRENVYRKVERTLGVKIDNLIECEEVLTPKIIETRTSSYTGSLYGTSSNNRMAAFLRHPNFSRRIKNLYFCGGSVHPGGGIPLCLLSAKIAVDQIKKA